MIVAPISPEFRLPAGVASVLTSTLEKVGLRVTAATVVAGMREASITPANSAAKVAGLPALSAVVMA